MKSFFENYGFVILSAIVIIILIGISTPIGTLVRENISHIVDSFGNKTSQRLDYVMRELHPKDVITIAGRKLTIMENLGDDKYLVMAEVVKDTQKFNFCSGDNVDKKPNGDETGTCAGKKANKYKGSNIDKYLNNNYYEALPETIKNAIIEKEVIQYRYHEGLNRKENKDSNESDYWYGEHKLCEKRGAKQCWIVNVDGIDYTVWSPDYGYKKYNGTHEKYGVYKFNFNASKDVYSKTTAKVFLPSVEELNKIVKVNDSKDMEDFLKTKTSPQNIWLRDAYGNFVLYGNTDNRSLNNNVAWIYGYYVCPCFVIDLSKASFTIE